MADAKSFGRRDAGGLLKGPPAAAPARELPTLKDLGFTPADDAEELRAYKREYGKRRFISRGGWRWVAGVCFLASTINGFMGLGSVSALLGAAGVGALGYSFLKPFLPSRTP